MEGKKPGAVKAINREHSQKYTEWPLGWAGVWFWALFAFVREPIMFPLKRMLQGKVTWESFLLAKKEVQIGGEKEGYLRSAQV